MSLWGPRKPRVSQYRIHQLEYELGFRDDPPRFLDPADIKFGPGVVIPVDGDPRSLLFGDGWVAGPPEALYVGDG